MDPFHPRDVHQATCENWYHYDREIWEVVILKQHLQHNPEYNGSVREVIYDSRHLLVYQVRIVKVHRPECGGHIPCQGENHSCKGEAEIRLGLMLEGAPAGEKIKEKLQGKEE